MGPVVRTLNSGGDDTGPMDPWSGCHTLPLCFLTTPSTAPKTPTLPRRLGFSTAPSAPSPIAPIPILPETQRHRAAAQTNPFRFSPPTSPLSIGSPGPSRAHRLHWGTKKPPLPCLPRTGAPLSKNVWALERLPQWSHATIDWAPSQHKPDHALRSTPSPIPRHPSTLRDSMRAFVGPYWS